MEFIDDYIDLLERKAGKKNNYQYTILALSIAIWINCWLVIGSAPFFQDFPLVKIENTKTKVEQNVKLSNEYCGSDYVVKEFLLIPKYSISIYFDFYCDKNQMGVMNILITSGVMMGFIGLLVLNSLLGKKLSILISLLIVIISSILITFSTKIWHIFTGLFLFNIFGMVSCHTSILLAQEVVNPSKRSLFSTLINFGYVLGLIVYAALIYFIDSWKIPFYILMSLVAILFTLIYLFVYESSKTFLIKKQYDEFIFNLLDIAVFNNRKDKFLKFLISNNELYFLNFSKNEKSPSLVKKYEKHINSDDIFFMESCLKLNLTVSENENFRKKNGQKSSDSIHTIFSVITDKKEFISKNSSNKQNISNLNISEEFLDKNHQTILNNISSNSPNDHKLSEENKNELDQYLIKNNEVDDSVENKNEKLNEIVYIDFKIIKSYFKYNENLNEADTEIDKSYNLKEEVPTTNKHAYSALDLICFKSQRLNFLKCSLIWMFSISMYFSNTLSIKYLPGTIFLNCTINALVEGLSIIFSEVMMNSKILGRKGTLLIFFGLCLIGHSILSFVSLSETLCIIIPFINKLALAGIINLNMVLTGEIYPNTIKNIGYSINSTVGQMFTIGVSYLIEIIPINQVYLIFSIFSLVGLLISATLKETRACILETEIPELLIKN